MKPAAQLSCLILTLLVPVSFVRAEETTPQRKISAAEYRDKAKAGWIGQIAGVAWGAPTEFRFKDKIIPDDAMPKWAPGMINDAFDQDDLYVEMTFLRTMEQYGFDCSIRQAGIDFANSGYRLWCANRAGRNNLRRGIAPPDSGHPTFNRCPNDIDYQIEADFSGLIAPGMPNVAIALGEKFGRLMNYGDGVYAGQFMGGMYAEAFFETDITKIIAAGLRCIPTECQYAEMVRDMLSWHGANPDDWEATWRLCQKKYREEPEYQKASNGGIDCKINGAYVLMGLLYGGGDLDKTIIISCRCGQDSDCNPSSAAGVLFTSIGFSKLPARFSDGLNEKAIFSHTAYNFPALLDVCEKLARQAVVREGGRVENTPGAEDLFVIPTRAPKPSPLELSWAPGPIANSRFSEGEMARITVAALPDGMREGLAKFAPGWEILDCGDQMHPGLKAEALGRKDVLLTHPLDQDTPCLIQKKFDIPAGERPVLMLSVGHHPKGDWLLVVRANGKKMLEQKIGKDTATDGWLDARVDLAPLAGKGVTLELLNQPTGWSYEGGYWGKIAVETE